ncbi:MAG TPA: hypothetical protein VFY73_17800 [Ideonella sp.]|nr:hypothetical protein [Ideonella sp.]HEX5685882.1 hypothetical protein [Ideonella sp.]
MSMKVVVAFRSAGLKLTNAQPVTVQPIPLKQAQVHHVHFDLVAKSARRR